MTVTISGSGGIAVPLGSASAPAETNTTSSTTGAYYPTSTTYGISTAGTNAVYIDASQNVGIGTATPAQKLDVKGILQITNSATPANTSYVYDGGGLLLSSNNSNPMYFYTGAAERMRLDTSGNLQVGGTTVTNTAGYVNSRTNARAWVNFDGTLTTPITPRSNYNVSSVTKNATGNYTLNFTTSLADANYACVGMCSSASPTQNNFILGLFSGATKTTSALQVAVTNGGTATLTDVNNIMVAVFGN
jgi:hypothetical protein